MVYSWKCSACEKITDTVQSVANIDVKPEKCDHCTSTSFTTRVIVRPANCKGVILLGETGWHDKEYSRTRSIRG